MLIYVDQTRMCKDIITCINACTINDTVHERLSFLVATLHKALNICGLFAEGFYKSRDKIKDHERSLAVIGTVNFMLVTFRIATLRNVYILVVRGAY